MPHTPPRCSIGSLSRRRTVQLGAAAFFITAGYPGTQGASGRAAFQASPEAPASDSIELTGLVANPGALTVADLQALPTETIQHVQETRQGPEEHTFTGTRLYNVLDLVDLVVEHDERNPLLRRYLVITARDDHQVVISGGELDPNFGDSPIMLAWEEDSQSLTGERGPVRLVCPGDERGGRQTDGVIHIDVRGIEEGSG